MVFTAINYDGLYIRNRLRNVILGEIVKTQHAKHAITHVM